MTIDILAQLEGCKAELTGAQCCCQSIRHGSHMVPRTSLRYQLFSRPPGELEKDFWYAFDLLRNPKDHVEFTLVRDFVRDALLEVCSQVKLDTEKSVLKQAAVQHLYGRLSGVLKPHANDAQLLVSTPLAASTSHSAQHGVLSCIT